jgi:hypothetical protein
MQKTADFSPCRRYRYALTRKWAEGPQVLFIMLNPSTADAMNDDPTIARCLSFAKSWGFCSLAVGNLFAWRTPSPAELLKAQCPVGDDNDGWLGALQASADMTLAAWGNNGAFNNRGTEVARRLTNPHMLGLTKRGHPSHPLYIGAKALPQQWKSWVWG